MYTDLTMFCVGPEWPIHQVIAQMDVNGEGIALVLDSSSRLLGTVTDGDVRRAVLADLDLEQPVTGLLDQKKGSAFARPVTAPAGTDAGALLDILQAHSIQHLPLVDQDQRVVAMTTLHNYVPEQAPSVQAVIMAGGFGLRLRPLTEELPKPMLPVGGRPLLETIVNQLRSTGIRSINIAVNHKSEKITEHFGDGRDFGVDITYTTEDRPLGTAGGLGLIKEPDDTMLVINGDIFTQVDFRAMLDFHREHRADLTVAVNKHESQIPYGVVECDGAIVRGLSEKPVMTFFINAGIYLLEPSAYKFIPKGESYDMTDLITRILAENQPVVAFPIHEGWIDIGQQENYQQAQEYAKNRKNASDLAG